MSRIIILIPIGIGVGLTGVSLGVIRAMECKDVRLGVFKPITQPRVGGDAPDQTTGIVRANSSLPAIEPLKMSHIGSLLSSNQKGVLIEEIIANYHANTKDAEVVLVEGLVPTRKHQFAQSPNYKIVKMLNVEIAFVMSQSTDTPEQLDERIELTCSSFGGTKNTNITGIVVNKLNAPVGEQGHARSDPSEILSDSSKAKVIEVDPARPQESNPLPVLDAVPWSFDLVATRAIDMARHLSATIVNEGDINTRRVKSVTFCARSIPHTLEHFRAGSLLITSADRPDALVAACLTAMNGVETGALLLIGGYEMDARITELCECAFETGLPVFMVNINTWQASLSLQSFNLEVPVDGRECIERVQEYVINCISADWTGSLTATSEHSRRLSPSAFRYQLTELARKADKRAVLPEDDKPCTVKAAVTCAERGIATCVLLGNPDEIAHVAASQGVELGADVEVVGPDVVRESYVVCLVELRENKGMAETVACEQLENNVVLGILMLEQDDVDGLVSDAVHTATNTIRPPLQLTKTTPGSSLMSSVFFMLLPDQVYVYGDCAINPNLTAEQLAEIAIQSADSAITFDVEPRVAMLSYSTGTSGASSDVERVHEITHLAQEERPDLMIDGPLQYDAAVMADIAESKASNSPVADRIIMLIFPDLNIGNTAYKAVQYSADLISIEPMLQGMHKPVNDLSRGALVDGITYTVALTTIQSSQRQQ